MSETQQVAVIGSLNIDTFLRVDILPKPGETVPAERFETSYGGKGANQAIAASRQGCRVALIGTVGSDEAGENYRNALKDEGIDISHIRSVPGQTGAAFITVDSKGENTIVTVFGANRSLRRVDIRNSQKSLEASAVLLAQFEVPSAPLVDAATLANKRGIPVIINASPSNPSFPWEDIQTDYVIVNEAEVMNLLGFLPGQESLSVVRQQLHQLRIENLIVTRGADDTLIYCHKDEVLSIPTLPVLPVDTVGAGDAFAGCFAARLALGESLLDALYSANCAGALTTLGTGAQNPIPDWDKVDQHLEHLKTQA